ncbi:hypothetical protein C789_4444 [Microcystis aeruginosa FACHB-905 = DIANCHI905]|uniref:Uncharacterized protein n=1 Tax=Microcystis aeruginosa PCC 7806SL TaxID=1903187 RepID=A0AB33BXA4_MICA7|nr:hypothetical protein BH695_5298 [Microcystis aeruginosa PCC 7806SL]ELS45766.1 hypothetical protein C789_4444 [Microcystis aeruginosa FACHB-905 = DIANCHI905]
MSFFNLAFQEAESAWFVRSLVPPYFLRLQSFCLLHQFFELPFLVTLSNYQL